MVSTQVNIEFKLGQLVHFIENKKASSGYIYCIEERIITSTGNGFIQTHSIDEPSIIYIYKAWINSQSGHIKCMDIEELYSTKEELIQSL